METPFSAERERSVLVTIIVYGELFDGVRGQLSRECFYDTRNREIYDAIVRVADKGTSIDALSVSEEAEIGGKMAQGEVAAYVADTCPDELNLKLNVEILKEYSVRRLLIEAGNALACESADKGNSISDVMENVRKKLDSTTKGIRTSVKSLRECLVEFYNMIGKNGDRSNGITTGFPELDKLGGFHHSDLVVIAGASSHGKTSLATSIAVNAAKAGHRIAFYSMEMTRMQLTARMAAIETKMSASSILYDPLTSEQLQAVDMGVRSMEEYQDNFFFDDEATSKLGMIIGSIRTMKARERIDMAFVDYLQILNVNEAPGFNREQLMGDAARRLKNLAKELDICIVALSQLNRDSTTPVPCIDRLRDSGQIAEAADMVLLVYRPEQVDVNLSYPGDFKNVSIHETAMIDVAKGRNTGTGKFICGFHAKTTHLYPLAVIPEKVISRELPF